MRFLLPLLLALVPCLASADDQTQGSVQSMGLGMPMPAPLQRIEKEGGSVLRSFPAPDGLTGWVLRIQGRNLIVYSTPGGGYILSGNLVDKDGKNLSAEYADKYIPKPDAAKLVAELSADSWLVDEGAASAPLIYVYADPNCVYCNKMWNDIRPYVESGKLHVRWALLDFLKPTSAGRAAAILTARDRGAALAQDETKFDRDHEEGGIPELKPVPPDVDNVLKMHTEQMNDAGGAGTPTILVHKQDGWEILYGAPKDLPGLIASLIK